MSYKKSFLIGMAAVGFSAASISPAYAQTNLENQGNPEQNPLETTAQAEETSILSKAESHIGFDGEKFFVEDEDAVQGILTDEELKTLEEQLSERNTQVKNLIDEANSNPELNLTEKNDGVVVTNVGEQTGDFTIANAGETSIDFGLTGVTIKLSEREVQAVIDAGASGGGAAIGTALGIGSGPGAAISGAALSAVAASIVQSYVSAVPLQIKVSYLPPHFPSIMPQ